MGRPSKGERGGDKILYMSPERKAESEAAAEADGRSWQDWVRWLMDRRVRQLRKAGKLTPPTSCP